jgi:hypothetical protein
LKWCKAIDVPKVMYDFRSGHCTGEREAGCKGGKNKLHGKPSRSRSNELQIVD